MVLSDGVILPEHLPPAVQRGAKAATAGDAAPAVTGSLDEALEEWERRAILDALAEGPWCPGPGGQDPRHHRAQPLVPGQEAQDPGAHDRGESRPRMSPRSDAGTGGRPGRVRKAVFPAAGLGTRFLPATKAQPKEMLPLVDKPIIQYVVEEAVASGLDEIILVTGRNKRAIEDHFDAAFELEYYLQDRGKLEELAQIKTISEMASVSYVRQKEPLGLGHAMLCARRSSATSPSASSWATTSSSRACRACASCSTSSSGTAVRCSPSCACPEEIGRYGVIVPRGLGGNVFEVLDLVEKPDPEDAPSDLAIIGRYVLTPDIFPILAETPPDSRGEIQLTNGLRTLRGRRPDLRRRVRRARHDTGEKLGFLKATVEFALARAPIWPTPFAPTSRASICSRKSL